MLCYAQVHFVFFKRKTAYAMRISDWSSDVCSSDLSAMTREDVSLAKFPSLAFDRHCPGSIMVDARNGKRFVDESFHYQNFGETTLEKGITRKDRKRDG